MMTSNCLLKIFVIFSLECQECIKKRLKPFLDKAIRFNSIKIFVSILLNLYIKLNAHNNIRYRTLLTHFGLPLCGLGAIALPT